MKRAAYFPQMVGTERIAFAVYQISTIAILIYTFFLKVQIHRPLLFYTGVVLYVIGLLLLIISIVNFSVPSSNGINQNGLYRLSRNPIYMAYFICFTGSATLSIILLGFIVLFQISAHWVILSEERWCVEQFGSEYLQYMKRVKRYI